MRRYFRHGRGFLSGDPANSAFQNYPIAIESLTATILDHLSFEEACVLPLAVSTTSAGNLDLGGASSVGATAIQLASASELKVITTAALPNHALVKALGADLVFDHKSPTVVDDIATAIEDAVFVGAHVAIVGPGSFKAVAAIMGKINKFAPVASVLPYGKPTEQFAPNFSKIRPHSCLKYWILQTDLCSFGVLAFDIIKEPHRFIGA
ncbi:hypothetical protein F9C07_2233396 [Aspergillus flavus]|uniref:Alcohol dehydrogenase-like C-terminal domain-containing protein n=1 Tax=Aspergillus flavus (strain ATCC 200026 / FGSC A1120 / IAM 13836 / NRRL 3357 / JCM 12722 / SRRC 167) TaxID=332952 RepID=A0A7U2MWA6_ASPFN|nr:hypothetical protein F9C07_2233396 [Aspergillus flavus]